MLIVLLLLFFFRSFFPDCFIGPYVGRGGIKSDFRKTGSHLNLGCLRNLKGERGWREGATPLRPIYSNFTFIFELRGTAGIGDIFSFLHESGVSNFSLDRLGR